MVHHSGQTKTIVLNITSLTRGSTVYDILCYVDMFRLNFDVRLIFLLIMAGTIERYICRTLGIPEACRFQFGFGLLPEGYLAGPSQWCGRDAEGVRPSKQVIAVVHTATHSGHRWIGLISGSTVARGKSGLPAKVRLTSLFIPFCYRAAIIIVRYPNRMYLPRPIYRSKPFDSVFAILSAVLEIEFNYEDLTCDETVSNHNKIERNEKLDCEIVLQLKQKRRLKRFRFRFPKGVLPIVAVLVAPAAAAGAATNGGKSGYEEDGGGVQNKS
ncbi:hypothetical protein M0802_004614 [Mischocyttarus mexicanus]|nr:hypothetical protein M0802_004614 [Mischocyttarus mexicanus]